MSLFFDLLDMRNMNILRICSIVVFSAGIGMLAGGIVISLIPLLVAGIVSVLAGSLLVFGTTVESRRF